MVDKFELGKKYVYNGRAHRKEWKNSEMDKVLDNEPRLCVYAHGYYAKFEGFDDVCIWDDGLDNWSEFKKGGTKKEYAYKPGTSVLDYVKSILEKETDEERKKYLRSYVNCVLPETVKEMIDEALTVVLNKDKFEDWGINEHFEKGLTNSIMIYGPPGTGKTMVCESIAAILGKNLIKVDNAKIQSNVPGQFERNIKSVFETANSGDAVIMLDECDSMLGNRNHCGQIMAGEINSLLTEIERFSGVVVLTTNRLPHLDEALQRRIIAKIRLEMPNEKARNQIWSNLIPKKMPLHKDVDIKKLSAAKLSGGEIKNAILLAARKAIAKCKDNVEHEMFVKAIDTIVDAKVEFESSQKKWIRPDEV